MSTFDQISKARKLLELPEKATMEEIKSNYRRLLSKWHPDKCGDTKKECTEMTRKIISAHETIMHYCLHYEYSFSERTVKRHYTPEEWWLNRFGDDPLWGNGRPPK